MYEFKDKINYSNFFIFDKTLVRTKRWARLPLASKSIFPVIAVHCNKNGVAFPSQETIAILAGCTEKTVRIGIEGLMGFPSFNVERYTTRTGHRGIKYHINLVEHKKGLTFPFYKCIVDGGNWSLLSQSAQALFLVIKTFAFFDFNGYAEHMELDDIDELDFFSPDNSYFQNREYDFFDAEIDVIAEYSGIGRSTVYTALSSLAEHCLIERTESIRGYDTWKVFRIPPSFYKREWLNKKVNKKYGKELCLL
jgi:hypothetical protein